nr:TetR family transcriptional regulator [Kineococcus aurantiacus]
MFPSGEVSRSTHLTWTTSSARRVEGTAVDHPRAVPGTSSSHQQVAADERATILTAAATLSDTWSFARTSLAQIATTAGVSQATLFKQFPTEDALFDAIVEQVWTPPGRPAAPLDPADPEGAGSSASANYRSPRRCAAASRRPRVRWRKPC